jgi:hypothetical protein
MRLLSTVFSLLVVTALSPAQAATTVYATSVYQQSGGATNASAALGAPDASFATLIAPAALVLQLANPVTGLNTVIDGILLTPGSSVRISIGEIISGTATFSAQIVVSGAGPFSLDLSGACASVSATGCSLIRFRTTGGSSFSLNSVSGVSNAPEPSIWAMMLAAFGLTGWRLKQIRPKMRRAFA